MSGPGTSKHCVTNMTADEEADIAAVIEAIFLVNKEEEKNRETVFLDLLNVLAVLRTNCQIAFFLYETSLKNLVLLVQ